MKNTEYALSLEPDEIMGYLDGLNITKEKYLKNARETTYSMWQRHLLLKSKRPSEKKIAKEAEKRNVPISTIENEYDEKYTYKLVKKADIEYVDEEVKSIMEK